MDARRVDGAGGEEDEKAVVRTQDSEEKLFF